MGQPPLANALSLVASWETWCIPRPQPVDPRLILNPGLWNLETHYFGGFEAPTCRWKNTIHGTGIWRTFRTQAERTYYGALLGTLMSGFILSSICSFDHGVVWDALQTTTKEAEVAKCQRYMPSEFPNMECRLIPEDSQLGNRGRKASPEDHKLKDQREDPLPHLDRLRQRLELRLRAGNSATRILLGRAPKRGPVKRKDPTIIRTQGI